MGEDEYVRAEVCEAKHGSSRWMLISVLGLVSAFLLVATLSVRAGWGASTKAEKVATDLDAHEKVQAVEAKHLTETLDRFDEMLKEILNKVNSGSP